MFVRALILALAAACVGGAVQARNLDVGKDKEFKTPSAAINSAKDGDHVRIYPGEYFDCAVVSQNKLVIEGVGAATDVVLTDKPCQGKALLVTQGRGIVVRNLTLTRARVPDGNGAGIRNESAELLVENVQFVNNQNGILSTPSEAGTLIVKDSLFDRNGSCISSGGCAHGIYVSTASLLRVEHSVFTGTKQGHHIKSKAARSEIIDCVVKDGPEGTASYLIEQPIGGSLVVRGSTLEKGLKADNHTAAIMIGAEGVSQRTAEIIIENNSFTNDGDYQTTFVKNLTATEAVLRGNRIKGAVTPLLGDGSVTPAS